jgi:hypothetical protein
VNRKGFEGSGRVWPLTVTEATLGCEPGDLLWVEAGGTRYALNGLALSAGGYRDLHAIWLPNTGGQGAPNVNIGDLMAEAKKTCPV